MLCEIYLQYETHFRGVERTFIRTYVLIDDVWYDRRLDAQFLRNQCNILQTGDKIATADWSTERDCCHTENEQTKIPM